MQKPSGEGAQGSPSLEVETGSADVAHRVEHLSCKEDVAGSSPVIGSEFGETRKITHVKVTSLL
jgi:hypothetical protein